VDAEPDRMVLVQDSTFQKFGKGGDRQAAFCRWLPGPDSHVVDLRFTKDPGKR